MKEIRIQTGSFFRLDKYNFPFVKSLKGKKSALIFCTLLSAILNQQKQSLKKILNVSHKNVLGRRDDQETSYRKVLRSSKWHVRRVKQEVLFELGLRVDILSFTLTY